MINFTDAKDSIAPSVVAATASVTAAIIAGCFAIWSNSKSNRTAIDLQSYKSGVDRDLERLKAKLEHGQLISSTQWNAEFAAYQALWKSLVLVRGLTNKLALREREFVKIGLKQSDIEEEHRILLLKKLIERHAIALTRRMRAINNHAPFYTAEVRKTANEALELAQGIHNRMLAQVITRTRRTVQSEEELRNAQITLIAELKEFTLRVDSVEGMIRKRLADVQVLNHVNAY